MISSSSRRLRGSMQLRGALAGLCTLALLLTAHAGRAAECDDSIDNDGDGDIDLADSDCPNAADLFEGVGVLSLQKISDTAGYLSDPGSPGTNPGGQLADSDHFGSAVEGIGDLDGDGVPDVAIGAYLDDTGDVDAGAIYILFLNADGTVKAEQKIAEGVGGLVANLETDDRFGTDIALLGDVDGDSVADLAVAAPNDDEGAADGGSLYVLFLNTDGTVKAEQKILGFDAGDGFGNSPAGIGDLDGDGVPDVAVGSILDDAAGGNAGSLRILLLNADGTVRELRYITEGEGGFTGTLDTSDRFGSGLAHLGDLNGDGRDELAVGARFDGANDAGVVYLLSLNTDGTVASHVLIEGGTNGFVGPTDSLDRFSRPARVGDLDGDGVGDLAVGAVTDDDGAIDAGAVWILLLNPDGSVHGERKISGLPELDPSDFFGNLSSAGDIDGNGVIDLVVGADGDDDGGAERGAAYILFLDGAPAVCGSGVLDPIEGCDDGNTTSGDGCFATCQVEDEARILGTAEGGAVEVTIAGVVVSVSTVPAETAADVAAALAAAINADASLQALGIVAEAVGDGVYTNGTFAFGASLDPGLAISSIPIAPQTGLLREVETAMITSDQIANNASGDILLGHSVAIAGDINGDGFDDVIVGAPDYDSDGGFFDGKGAAFVFLGSAAGITGGTTATADTYLQATQPGASFGHSVSSAGDVNGDGYDDVIVGAPGFEAGESGEGAAFLFLGGPTGIADGGPSSASAQLEGNQQDARFGWSVSTAGDVNRDGYDDVIVGADLYDVVEPDVGASFVFLGSAFGIASGGAEMADSVNSSIQPGARYGFSVSDVGDWNGDGFGDVIVGAPRQDVANLDEGSAFVLFGSALGTTGVGAVFLRGGYRQFFGHSVSGAGDVNGDGVDDVIVGAPDFRFEGGSAFVFLGGAGEGLLGDGTLVYLDAVTHLENDQDLDIFVPGNLGESVSGAGDVNGDGYADVIVGAPRYETNASPSNGRGAALVFLGGPAGIASGIPGDSDAQIAQIPVAVAIGASVAGGGDTNGDGYADVIVGSPLGDPAQDGTSGGAAFVYLGESAGKPSPYGVDSLSDGRDGFPGDGICGSALNGCTLRTAVEEANARLGMDTIVLGPGTHVLNRVGDGEDEAATGDVDIMGDLRILGAGADCTTGTVIVETTSSAEAAITVIDGSVTISGVCISGSHRGIDVVGGRLELQDFTLAGNDYGLSVGPDGQAVLRLGAIEGNGGGSLGGGVLNEGLLSVDRVRLEGNSSTADPFLVGIQVAHGAMVNMNTGRLLVTNSSISGNTTNAASALYNLGTAQMSNVSIFDNTALDQWVLLGTISVPTNGSAPLDLTNVTISDNSHGAFSINGGASITARNTIVEDVWACSNPISSDGHNIELQQTCGFTAPGDQQSTAVSFSVDSSGPTRALIPGAGATSVRNNGDEMRCPHVDQRLHRRSALCDIGAVEINAALACNNGLDDDGDGFCDAIGATCFDGSAPGDPGCVDAADPRELELSAGDVLVGDSDGSVKRLDPDTGDVSIVSRGLGLYAPFGIATGNGERIFASDGDRIVEIDPETGVPALLAAAGGLGAPRGISLERSGELLVADRGSGDLLGIDPDRGDSTVIANGTFIDPEYVLADARNLTLLVAAPDSSEPLGQGVHRIDRLGNAYQSCTSGILDDPRQLVQSRDGSSLWVAENGNASNNQVYEIDLDVTLDTCSPVPIGGGAIDDAWGLALHPGGDLIVASTMGGVFRSVDPDSGVQTPINESPDIATPHEIAVVPEPDRTSTLLLGVAVIRILSWARHRKRFQVVD